MRGISTSFGAVEGEEEPCRVPLLCQFLSSSQVTEGVGDDEVPGVGDVVVVVILSEEKKTAPLGERNASK